MDECIYVALEVETEGKYSLITTCALEAFVFVCFHPLFYSLYAFSLLSDLLSFGGLKPLRTGSHRDSCDPPLAGISNRVVHPSIQTKDIMSPVPTYRVSP